MRKKDIHCSALFWIRKSRRFLAGIAIWNGEHDLNYVQREKRERETC